MTRPGGLADEALDALADAWHDRTSSIRMRVGYWVQQPNGMDCHVPGITRLTAN